MQVSGNKPAFVLAGACLTPPPAKMWGLARPARLTVLRRSYGWETPALACVPPGIVFRSLAKILEFRWHRAKRCVCKPSLTRNRMLVWEEPTCTCPEPVPQQGYSKASSTLSWCREVSLNCSPETSVEDSTNFRTVLGTGTVHRASPECRRLSASHFQAGQSQMSREEGGGGNAIVRCWPGLRLPGSADVPAWL